MLKQDLIQEIKDLKQFISHMNLIEEEVNHIKREVNSSFQANITRVSFGQVKHDLDNILQRKRVEFAKIVEDELPDDIDSKEHKFCGCQDCGECCCSKCRETNEIR